MMNDKTIATWRRMSGGLLAAALAAAVVATPASAPGQVDVVNPTVQAGEAVLNVTNDIYHVQQNSMNAIIDYDALNIYSGGSMIVNQINSQAALLNRINGASPTMLDGNIQAQGRLFFVNPAGVIFGPNAVLDVAGIYAAAGNIANEDFMVGSYRFTDLAGDVINYGTINADFVALVGRRVINDGIILSPDGMVAMVAGDEVVIGEQNGNILVKVEKSSDIGEQAGVENNGTIDTGSGGQVVLGAGDMYWLGVKQTATGVVKSNDITVEAMGSRAEVSGTLDASNADGDGGSIRVLADEIALYSAYVDASGATAGGQIRIGGSVQGQGPLPNAKSVLVDAGSVLYADATQSGRGGSVVLWADESMEFYGSVYARGAGELPGSGGFVEVSGIHNWVFGGTVDTGGGWLLLDPIDVTVDGVLAAALVAALGANNVVLHTVDSGSTDAGDITINNAVSWNSAFAFAVMAEGTVNANADVTNAGTGAITIVAGWDASTGFSPTDADNDGETGVVTFGDIIADIGSYGAGGSAISLAAGVDINSGGAVNMAADSLTNGGNAISGASVTIHTLRFANTGGITTTTGALTLAVGTNGTSTTNTLGTLTLGSVGNTITAGTGNDTIILTNTQADLVIDAVSGNDTLRGPSSGTVDWVVDSATTGTIDRDGETTWQNFDILRGRNADDNWTINAGINFTGTIGHSTNNGANTLTLLAGATLTGTYTGGSGADTIFFNPGASITGVVDGNAGTDTLDYSAFGATVDVVLTALGTTNGFDGDVGSTVSTFADFDAVVGSAMTDDSLTGLDADSTWTIGTGSDDYVSTNTFGFSALEEFFGGTADDDFTVTPGANPISIDGGTETTADTLTIDTTPITDPVLTPTTDPTTGTWSFTGGADVDFTEIETNGVSGPITSFGLLFDAVILGVDDGADDAWNLALNGAMDTIQLTGAFTFSQLLAQVDSVTIVGSGDDDTLTVDFANGNPFGPGGLFFTAGGEDDDGDSMVLDNGTFTTVTHFFDNSNDGTVDVDGDLITYTGLEPITDNLDATDRVFTFDTTSDTITINGTADPGGADDGVSRIDSNNSEIVDFANPTGSLTVNAADGDDVVNYQGLDSDTGTPYAGTVALNGDAGDDTFHLGSSASLDSLAGSGAITIAGGTHTTGDSLNLDDEADGTANTYTVSDTAVTRTDGAITVNYATVEDLSLGGGMGGNQIDITATAATTPVTVNTGTGANTVNVSSDAPTNTGDLDGIDGTLAIVGEGTDTLNLADPADATADTVTISNAANTTTISGLSPADITYQSAGGADLDVLNITAGTGGDTFNVNAVTTTGETTISTGAGNDTVNVNATTNLANLTLNGDAQAAADILVGPNIANIWTVTGSGTFGPTGTEVTFTGFETLTGNADTDTFNVTGAGGLASAIAGTFTIIGAGGSDELNIDDSATAGDITWDVLSAVNTQITGGTLTINIDATMELVSIDGGTGDDTFNAAPSATAALDLDGGTENTGDSINLDVAGFTSPVNYNINGPEAATITPSAADFMQVAYSEMESFDLLNGTMIVGLDTDLIDLGGGIIGGDAADDTITITMDGTGTQLEININTVDLTALNMDDVASLNVSGSTDNDLLNINEHATGGLPEFTVDASEGHSNTAFAGSAFSGIIRGLHFDGDGGATNAVAVTLANSRNTGYYSDTVDTANSGVIAFADDAGTPDTGFAMSFEGLSPVTLTGAGGTLFVDNSANPQVNVTIEDDPTPADGYDIIDGGAGYEDVTFTGYAGLTLLLGTDTTGGDQNLTVTLDALDTASTLTAMTLSGENTGTTDSEMDTFNIEAVGAALTLTLVGGGGNDTFNIATTGMDLSAIAGQVIVTGGTGTDALNISDAADAGGDAGVVDDTNVSGFGLGSQIDYATIETAVLTTGTGINAINVDGSGATTSFTINANDGNDIIDVNIGNIATAGRVLIINGDGDTDTLNVNGTAAGETYELRDDGGLEAIVRTAPTTQTVRYSTVENLQLDTSTGVADVISIVNPVDDVSDSVTLLTTQGAIVDNNAVDPDITTDELRLLAALGIGSAATLETSVSTLDFFNATSGNVLIANDVGGLLTITNLGNASHGNPGSGATTITNASPITVDTSYTFGGDTTLTASASGGADVFTISSAAIITLSSALDRVLTVNAGDAAGDNILFDTGRIVTAGGGTHTVNLIAGGNVTQNGGAVSVTADNLNIDAPTGVGTSTAAPLRVNVTELVVDTSGAGGDVFLRESDGLSAISLDTGGSAGGDAHIDLLAGTITQDGSDTIDVNGLSLTGTGTYNLNDDDNDATTLAAGVTGPVTYINALDAGRVTVGAVAGGATGITTTGATDITADGFAINSNVSGAGVTITGRSDDAVATDADTLVSVAAGVTVNANAGNLVVTAEDLTLDATSLLDGTGQLTVQPVDVGDAIVIGDTNTDAPSDDTMELNDTEIGRFSDGFSGIFIGQAAGTHAITVTSATFTDPLTLRAPVAGGTTTINGTLAGTGDASITILGADATTTFASGNPGITTEGDFILIDDDVIVADGVEATLDTTQGGNAAGADITINGTTKGSLAPSGTSPDGPPVLPGTPTANDEEALTINAGTGGTVTFLDDIGPQGAEDVALDVQITAMGNILELGAGGSPITFDAGNTSPILLFNTINDNGSTITGTGILTLAPLDLGRNVNVEGDLPGALNISQALINLLGDGWERIVIGRDGGTAAMEIAGIGDVTFLDPVTFNMNGTTGQIGVGDSAADNFTLINYAGTGTNGDDGTGIGPAFQFNGSFNTTTVFVDQITSGLSQVYNDDVVLANDVVFDTTNDGGTAAGADITFMGTLDGQTVGTDDVAFFTGTAGDLLFTGAVGSSVRVGDVYIGEAPAGIFAAPYNVLTQHDVNAVTAQSNFTARSLYIRQFDNSTPAGETIRFDGNITTTGFAASPAGGDVDIDTTVGAGVGGAAIVIGNINTTGQTVVVGAGPNGGNVSILAGDVAVAAITTNGGGTTDAAAGGNAGTIDLDAQDASPTIALSGNLTAAGGSGTPTGDGGAITIGDTGGATDLITLSNANIEINTTGNNAADVNFNAESVTGSGFTLTLNTGGTTTSADVNFNFGSDADGNDLTGLNNLIVTNADDVTVSDGDNVNVGSILQLAGGGATTFGGTVTTTDSDGLDLTTERIRFKDDVTVNAGNVLLNIDLSDASQDDAGIVGGDTLVIDDGVTIDVVAGSFTQGGGGANPSVVEFGGNISTGAGNVTFADHVRLDGNTENADVNQNRITTGPAGGNISFVRNIFAAGDETQKLHLTAGTGDITVVGAVGEMPGGVPGDAALGDLTIVVARDVTFSDTVDSVQVNQLLGVGNTRFIGAVTVTEGRGDAVPVDADLNDVAFSINTSGTLRLDSTLMSLDNGNTLGGGSIFISVGAGNTQFNGGVDSITADQTGGGANVAVLTIQPFTATGGMSIGIESGGVQLSNGDIDAIAEGFSHIFMGRADGTGTVTVNNGVVFKDPVFFRAPGVGGIVEVTTPGGLIIDDDAVFDAEDAPVTFDAPTINLGGTITTNGQDVFFIHGGSIAAAAETLPTPLTHLGDFGALDGNAAVVVTDAATITTDADGASGHRAGDVVFENLINSQTGESNDLTVSMVGDGAGRHGDLLVGTTGTSVTGRVGGVRRLGNISVTQARDVTFGNLVDQSGAVSALSFEQLAGSGDTTFFGEVDIFGDGVFVALQTGGFSDMDGGSVSIVTSGDVTFHGAIVSRGGARTLTDGDGYDGGAVDIVGANIEVQRIDSRGANARNNGDGGLGGAVALDATDGGTPDILLHGDILASGGDGLGGGQEGSASDITLGDAGLTDIITLDPENANVGAHNTVTDVIRIAGNDVFFNGPVDAMTGDGDGESLYVDTFANFTQVPLFGLTVFNAPVGAGEPLDVLRTDTNQNLLIGVFVLTPRTALQVNTLNATNHLVGGFTVANTTDMTVNNEMTFQDGFVASEDVTLTALTASTGTVRFNNTVNADAADGTVGGTPIGAADGDEDITVVAPITIFDDESLVGTGVQQTSATATDGVDGIVGGAPGLDATLRSLGTLNTTLSDATLANTDRTVVNTSAMTAEQFIFDDPVEMARGTAGTPATTTITASMAEGDPDPPFDDIGDDAVQFNNILNSFPGELNNLTVNTTGGGVTRFGDGLDNTGAADTTADRVGDVDRLARLTTNADGQVHIYTDRILTNGTSVTHDDPVILFNDVLYDEDHPDGIITFNNTVDSDGTPRDLTVTTAGGEGGAKPDPDNPGLDATTLFNGIVGGTSPLDVLIVNHDGAGVGVIPSATDPGGDVTRISADIFADTMHFYDNIQIGAATVTLTGVDSAADGTTVIFHAMLDSEPTETNSLTVIATLTQFADDVGSMEPLDMLQTTDGGGPDTTILGDNTDGDPDIELFANMFVFDDPVVLQDDTTITGHKPGDGTDTAAEAIAFNNTVDSDAPGTPRDLTVITTAGGLTRFGDDSGDNVGGTNPLDVFKADIYPGNGFTLIHSAIFNVTDEATFNDQVAIGTDGVTITASDAAGTIRFNNTLDAFSGDAADTNDLTLAATTTIFDDDGAMGQGVNDADTTTNDAVDGIVGGANPLGTLRTTDGGGPDVTVVNTTQMTANVLQFDDRVIVATDLTTFASGANPGSGAAVFTGNRDDTPDTNPPYDHTNDAIQFNNHLDSASGENNEIYLNTPNGGTTLIGNDDADTVGTAAAFRPGRLVTDAPGQTHIEAASINTSGASIIYNDPVVLFSDVVMSEFGTGFVHFNSTVNSDGLATPRDLTVRTTGGLTRFGDNDGVNDDRVGAIFPLDDLYLTHTAGTIGADITQVNVDLHADDMTFDDRVELGTDAPVGDGTIRMSAESAGNTSNSTVTFNSSVNSVEDIFANLTIDSLLTTFGDGTGNDRVGTRVDDGLGTDGALDFLFTTGTPGTEMTVIRTDQLLANQFQHDSDVVIDFSTVTFTGLADGSAPNDFDGSGDGVGDAMVFNGTISSDMGDFNNLNLDTVNGGDVWINNRVGTMDLTPGDAAAKAIAQPAAAGGLEGTELGTFRTDNPDNPLVDSGHFLVDVPPHDVAGDLVPNGTTHINTDVVKAGGDAPATIEFYDPIVIDTDGVYISDFSDGIFFFNTLDSAADEENDVFFYAPGFFDDGDIEFHDVVGDSDGDDDTTNTRLGDVIVYSVDDLTAMDLFKVASYTQEGMGMVGGSVGSGRGDTIFMGLVDTSGVAGGPAPDGGTIYVINENIPANGPLSRTIEFRMGADLDGAGAGDDAGNFMIRPDAGSGDLLSHLGGLAPRTWIVLGGDFSLLGGAGGLNGNFEISPDGFEDIPTVATYTGYLTFLGVGGGVDVSITTGTFYTGRAFNPNNTKGTFYGSLVIDARGSALTPIMGPDPALDPVALDDNDFVADTALISVMDIASVDDMTFIVPGPAGVTDIEISLRAASTVLPISGPQVPDLGVDVVVGGFTDWSETPIYRPGTVGPPVTFSNPGATGNVSSTLEFFPYRDFGAPIDETTYLRLGAPIRLDPSSEGPSNANAAEALAAQLPKPEQSGVVLRETIVGDQQRELLAEFAGVDLSGLTPAQRLEFLTGRELYADLPDSLAVQVAIARALITENRLLYEPVSEMLTFYRRMFLEEVVNPETGQVELISRHVENRRALASALGEYRGLYGQFDAQQFLSFIQGSQTHADALHTVRSLSTLSRKFELMGLSPREVGEAMLGVAELIVPDGMTPEQLVAVINLAAPLDDESAVLEPEPGLQVPDADR